MLAQEVIGKYKGSARFAVQDLGASPLAERYGIDKYPAVFVDDALVARPEDFYVWGGPAVGKYLPWDKIESRRRYQSDLARMIDIRLAGGEVPSLAASQKSSAEQFLPAGDLVDLQGKPLRLAKLGKPVLLEFWASWCPFCLETLTWMKQLDPASVTVVGVVVDSDRKDVDALITKLQPPGRMVIGTPELRAAFNGPPAVPTLALADKNGKIVRMFYGAPKNLHEEIERELVKLRDSG